MPISSPETSIGVIIEIYDLTPVDTFGVRQNGSTDNRITPNGGNHSIFQFVVGVDVNQTIELYRGTVQLFFYLHAYITEGATFYLNGIDVSPPAVGAWDNLATPLPANSLMGFLEISNAAGWRYGARRPGGLLDYLGTSQHNCAFPFCDANGIIEGRRENAGDTFHLIGYAHYTPPGEVRTDPATEIT